MEKRTWEKQRLFIAGRYLSGLKDDLKSIESKAEEIKSTLTERQKSGAKLNAPTFFHDRFKIVLNIAREHLLALPLPENRPPGVPLQEWSRPMYEIGERLEALKQAADIIKRMAGGESISVRERSKLETTLNRWLEGATRS